MTATRRYWQVERNCGDDRRPCWVPTDFRVGGVDEAEAALSMADTAGRAGWVARLGREVRADDRYCDFGWVNAN